MPPDVIACAVQGPNRPVFPLHIGGPSRRPPTHHRLHREQTNRSARQRHTNRANVFRRQSVIDQDGGDAWLPAWGT